MWTKKSTVRAGAAIAGTIVGWGLIRLLFPVLDYYPPTSLTSVLERSWFVDAGIRKVAMCHRPDSERRSRGWPFSW